MTSAPKSESAVAEGAMHNPAFSRRHPSLNVVYACTESVKQEGQVVAQKLDGATGALVEHCPPVGGFPEDGLGQVEQVRVK